MCARENELLLAANAGLIAATVALKMAGQIRIKNEEKIARLEARIAELEGRALKEELPAIIEVILEAP